jgi:hypothetical protein
MKQDALARRSDPGFLRGMSSNQKRPTTAWMSSDLFEVGIGAVVIARFKVSGEAEMGFFLVDVWCLGVKNAFFTRVTPAELQSIMDEQFEKPPIEISPACGRKLVESAVAYAGRLGIPPHRDYRAACRVLGGIDATQCDTDWKFGGQEGKPHYVSGPRDSKRFIDRLMAQLLRVCGEGNFNYTVVVEGEDGSDLVWNDAEWKNPDGDPEAGTRG